MDYCQHLTECLYFINDYANLAFYQICFVFLNFYHYCLKFDVFLFLSLFLHDSLLSMLLTFYFTEHPLCGTNTQQSAA